MLIGISLDNEVLANKNKVDNDEIKNYMIIDFLTLALQFQKIVTQSQKNIPINDSNDD